MVHHTETEACFNNQHSKSQPTVYTTSTDEHPTFLVKMLYPYFGVKMGGRTHHVLTHCKTKICHFVCPSVQQ